MSPVIKMELGMPFGLEILKDFIKEGLREMIEKYVEEQVRKTRTVGSIIYFTVFNPRVSTVSINEFLEDLAKSVGQKVPMKEPSGSLHLLIGKSQFIIYAYATKLSDILFYDAMYRELVDALEGGEEQYEGSAVENKDLAYEFGLEDSRVLEKISDITVVIFPLGKPRAEDVHKLTQAIYDRGVQALGSDRAVVKISIYAPSRSKGLNDVEEKLRDLHVRVYRSSNNDVEKLVVVLNVPSQILSDKVYRAIYGGGFSIGLIQLRSYFY